MSERSRNLVAIAVLAVSLAVVTFALTTAEPTPPERVATLAASLKCPICESESIADSPSGVARDLYALIEEQVADGWTDDEIIDYFVAAYGPQVLLDPPLDGRAIVLWLIPVAIAAAGVTAVVTRRGRAEPRALSPAEEAAVAEALREREGEAPGE